MPSRKNMLDFIRKKLKGAKKANRRPYYKRNYTHDDHASSFQSYSGDEWQSYDQYSINSGDWDDGKSRQDDGFLSPSNSSTNSGVIYDEQFSVQRGTLRLAEDENSETKVSDAEVAPIQENTARKHDPDNFEPTELSEPDIDIEQVIPRNSAEVFLSKKYSGNSYDRRANPCDVFERGLSNADGIDTLVEAHLDDYTAKTNVTIRNFLDERIQEGSLRGAGSVASLIVSPIRVFSLGGDADKSTNSGQIPEKGKAQESFYARDSNVSQISQDLKRKFSRPIFERLPYKSLPDPVGEEKAPTVAMFNIDHTLDKAHALRNWKFSGAPGGPAIIANSCEKEHHFAKDSPTLPAFTYGDNNSVVATSSLGISEYAAPKTDFYGFESNGVDKKVKYKPLAGESLSFLDKYDTNGDFSPWVKHNEATHQSNGLLRTAGQTGKLRADDVPNHGIARHEEGFVSDSVVRMKPPETLASHVTLENVYTTKPRYGGMQQLSSIKSTPTLYPLSEVVSSKKHKDLSNANNSLVLLHEKYERNMTKKTHMESNEHAESPDMKNNNFHPTIEAQDLVGKPYINARSKPERVKIQTPSEDSEDLCQQSLIERFSKATGSSYKPDFAHNNLMRWTGGLMQFRAVSEPPKSNISKRDSKNTLFQRLKLPRYSKLFPSTENKRDFFATGLYKPIIAYPHAYQNLEIRIHAILFRSWDYSSLQNWSQQFDIASFPQANSPIKFEDYSQRPDINFLKRQSSACNEIHIGEMCYKLHTLQSGIRVSLLDPFDRLIKLDYSLDEALGSTAEKNRKKIFSSGSKYRIRLNINRSLFIPLDKPSSENIMKKFFLDLIVQTNESEVFGGAILQLPIKAEEGRWSLKKGEAVHFPPNYTASNNRSSHSLNEAQATPTARIKGCSLYEPQSSLKDLRNKCLSNSLMEELRCIGKLVFRYVQITSPTHN